MKDFRSPISVLKRQPLPRQPRVTFPLWAMIAAGMMVSFAGGIAAATLIGAWLG